MSTFIQSIQHHSIRSNTQTRGIVVNGETMQMYRNINIIIVYGFPREL